MRPKGAEAMKMPKSLDPAYTRVKKENGASGQSESRRLFHNRLKDVCTANPPKKSHIFILSSGSSSQMLHVNPEARLEKLIKWGEGTRSCSRLPQCGFSRLGGMSFLQQLAAMQNRSGGCVPRCTSEWPYALPRVFIPSQARRSRRRVMRFRGCLTFTRFAKRWTRAALQQEP